MDFLHRICRFGQLNQEWVVQKRLYINSYILSMEDVIIYVWSSYEYVIKFF